MAEARSEQPAVKAPERSREHGRHHDEPNPEDEGVERPPGSNLPTRPTARYPINRFKSRRRTFTIEALSRDDQIALWRALQSPPNPTAAQRSLGKLIRSVR